MTERLVDKNPCCNCKQHSPCLGPCSKWRNWYGMVLDKLAQYETAEEEGRLAVMPCNAVGYVYTNLKPKGFYLREKDKPYRCRVDSIALNHNPAVKVLYYGGYEYVFSFCEFGKTVFLTREEAVKALKEMEEKQSE